MSDGKLEYICISDVRGKPKRVVDSAELRADHGIVDDAHAGPWHRQISILDVAAIEALRDSPAKGDGPPPALEPGAFGENLCVSGIDLTSLGLGSGLKIGAEAEVRITQIGKACHTPCEIYARMGDCIMPRRGLFARATWAGRIKAGDPIEVVERIDPGLFQVVILTISDRCSRGEAKDTAGPAVEGLLTRKAGYHFYRSLILPDEQSEIEKRLRHYSDGHSIDLIVTVGGTGFSPRDVTPEATRAVVERLVPGFNEAMRRASLAKTPYGICSRGISGIRNQTLIVNVSGSKKAAVENIRVILRALPHALEKLRGDPSDCASDR